MSREQDPRGQHNPLEEDSRAVPAASASGAPIQPASVCRGCGAAYEESRSSWFFACE